jgi:hypothetical protein
LTEVSLLLRRFCGGGAAAIGASLSGAWR